MLKKMMNSAWSVIVTISLFLLGAFLVSVLWPVAAQKIDQHRLSGLWHVEGTFTDWRFGSDGTFREEALISTEGRYQLRSGDRIQMAWPGFTVTYRYRFDGVGLLLTMDGESSGKRLTRKN